MLAGLPDRLIQAQRVFSRTDGLHAAGPRSSSRSGLTLVGFLRGTGMNVYTGTQRITAAALADAGA